MLAELVQFDKIFLNYKDNSAILICGNLTGNRNKNTRININITGS